MKYLFWGQLKCKTIMFFTESSSTHSRSEQNIMNSIAVNMMDESGAER